MEYNHPSSLNKSKSGQKYLLVITAIVITIILSCYWLLSRTGQKNRPQESASLAPIISDSTNMKPAYIDFSHSPFSSLDTKTKKLLRSQNYSDGTTYAITRHAERAPSTICYGDFDADGYKDVAIVMDNEDKQCSRLLIICTQTATKEKFLAFSENYADKIKINAFPKGSKIIMNNESPETSAIDGIIAIGEDVKLAVVYDTHLQKFNTFYQE